MKRELNWNLFGNDIYYTNSVILLVNNMLSSQLDCQECFNLVVFCIQTVLTRARCTRRRLCGMISSWESSRESRRSAVHPRGRIFIELMTSDRSLNASREGSKWRNYGTWKTWRYTMYNLRTQCNYTIPLNRLGCFFRLDIRSRLRLESIFRDCGWNPCL